MKHVCSHEQLELALAGQLNADEESALSLHLDECELCSAEIERLAGGQRVSQEVAAMLKPDDLDDALPLRSECSSADFVVEQLEPSDDPAVLGRIGGYDVLEVIGHGGMGVVLRGFDRELKRFVAIKALAPHLAHSALARKRFAREAQAAAAVVNLHVIAIHQVQPNGQLPFLVMPLLSGESLAERMKARGMLELKEVLRIGMQAAQGLAAAHSQGLVHRDIKPANILLEKGVDRAVLTDFGLARAADDVSMTRFGVIAGTPEYMSPEQARGEAVDGRSDLFSLGCVLYEMATGVSPFRADSTMATLRRIVDDKPVAMASSVPDLPPWFIGIVDRLLSKDPAQRFASASEVSALLEQCLSHLQQPTTVPLPRAAMTSVRGGMPGLTRWIIGGALAFVLVLAGIFIVLEGNKGQITIQCAADDIPVRIRQGETVVKQLTVTKSGATVRVAAGKYVVEINGVIDGIVVQNGAVSLQRRGVETVRIVGDDTQPRAESRTERGFMVSGPMTYAVSADTASIIACTGPKNPTKLGAIVADVNFDNALDNNVVWLHVWDWSKSDVSRVMLVQKSELGVLAPSGNMMLSTEGEAFNLATRETRQFSGFQVNDDQLISSVRLSPSGKYTAVLIGPRAENEPDRIVAANSGKWTLRLLELDAVTNTGKKIGEFPVSANAGVAFSTDEESVTYSSDKHKIIRRETTSGNILNEYEPAVRSPNGFVGLTVSPEVRLVAAADSDGNIYVWESQSGKLVVNHSSAGDDSKLDDPFRARVMRFSPGGTYLALAAGNQLQVLETKTGAIIKKHVHEASPQFTQLQWSQDAKSITLLTLFQPTNFVEEHGVSTRPTANIFPRVYEWAWRDGNPVVKQFRDAPRTPTVRAKSVSNIKQILLAMQRYHGDHRRFPAGVILGKDGTGKVPHSWRVELLPYLENGEALYREYQFDEPWDSAANRTVLAKMPAVFRHASAPPDSTNSAYYVVVGAAAEGAFKEKSAPTAFSTNVGMALREILDGASNTIAVVETNLVVPWTKPEDVLFDLEQGTLALGGYYEGGRGLDGNDQDGFYVGSFVGSVHFLPANISQDLLRAYLSPAGGEKIPPLEVQMSAGTSERQFLKHPLQNIKAVNAGHALIQELSKRGQAGSVELLADEKSNSIIAWGEPAAQRLVIEQLRAMEFLAEIGDETSDKAPPAPTGPQPDKEGIYWSERKENQWVTGMKVIHWPTPARRKLIVEFVLRNDAREAREAELDLYCGDKSSLLISEGNRAEVDFKETRRYKQTTEARKVAMFEEGRAEISFEGLESGDYTLRFNRVIYLRNDDGSGRDVPFDVRLPVHFDDSYDSLPIHWGKPVAGLRIGAMFRDARKGEMQNFNGRDHAKAHLLIQNVSRKDVDCGFDPPYHSWGMRVADSTGKQFESVSGESNIFNGIGILVPRPTLWARLAPGEIQPLNDPPQFRTGAEDDGQTPTIEDAQFSIVPANESDELVPVNLPFAEYIYILSSGQYTARASVTLRKKDSPNASFSAESGPCPFHVEAKQATANVQPDGRRAVSNRVNN